MSEQLQTIPQEENPLETEYTSVPAATSELVDDIQEQEETPVSPEADAGQHEYKVLSNPYERMDYVHLTDELIAKMDGTEGERPDFVIYLDKSARPVNWMVGELWDTLAAKDEDGNAPPKPQTLFANIDARRENLSDGTPRDSAEAIADLRAIYAVDTPAEGLDMMQAPTYLDGKRVLIVDEIQVSGDTLRNAKDYLSSAFPSATFETHAWMDATPPKPDAMAENNVRWYERENDRYRAVLDVVEPERAEELKASDPRVERGWEWLAKTPAKMREDAVDLLRDMKAIGEDVRSGRLPYIPAFGRPDYDERVKQFNGMSDDELIRFTKWAKQSFWPNQQHASALTDETGPLAPESAEAMGWTEAKLKAKRRGNREPSLNDYRRTLVRGAEAEAVRKHAEKIGFLGRTALDK